MITQTDRYILIEIAKGRTNSQIGETLHLVEGTIKNRVSALMRELGCENRAALATWAIENSIEGAVMEEIDAPTEEEDTRRSRILNHMGVPL